MYPVISTQGSYLTRHYHTDVNKSKGDTVTLMVTSLHSVLTNSRWSP